MALTPRQMDLLRAVVREYVATSRPVGSRRLVELGVVDASPSTVRSELGRLEELGLLEHPHTSAGRVPTDTGYRMFVDALALQGAGPSDEQGVPHEDHQRRAATVEVRAAGEIDGRSGARLEHALRDVTRALADATELLSLVTSPDTRGATVRHVEVLLLQPHVVCAVVITATGDVFRHVVDLGAPADPGLVAWAGSYLNEQVTGIALGQSLLRQRISHPDLSVTERTMLALLAPAFTDVVDAAAQEVHVGGNPEQLIALGSEVQQVANLVMVLDERRRVLDALRRSTLSGNGIGTGPSASSSGGGRVAVRIGTENDLPELRALSVVAADYGTPTRRLGIVGLIGPRAMDYRLAVRVVGAAAHTLSSAAADLHAT